MNSIKFYSKTLIIAIPLFIQFFFEVIITLLWILNLENTAFLLYKVSFLFIYIYYFILLFLFSKKKINLFYYEKILFFISVLFLFYNLIHFPISLTPYHKLEYFIQDALRGSIFFITLLSCIFIFNNERNKFRRSIAAKIFFIEKIFKYLVILNFSKAVVKLILVLNGYFYGPWLNQFKVEPFVLGFLIFKLHTSRKFLVKLTYLLLIFVLVFLSFLSLKRGIWLSLVLSIVFISIYYPFPKLKLTISFSFLTLLIFIVSYLSGNYNLIVKRLRTLKFENFSINEIEHSIAGRIIEFIGIIYSFKDAFIYNFIVGAGNGAMYALDPEFIIPQATIYSQGGEYIYHHIHSMIGIVFFRLGLLGLLFYLAPILILLYLFFFKFKKANIIRSRYALYFFLFSISLISVIPNFMFSNILYGSFYYALLIYSTIISYELYKYNLKKGKSYLY